MKSLLIIFVAIVLAGAAGFWFLTIPSTTRPDELAGLVGDPVQGQVVFNAGGCASCHSAPDAEGDARLELGGGRAFVTDFGTFYAPNISPERTFGIGKWQAIDLVNAMRHGTTPNHQSLYPAFPFSSYTKATLGDVVSLFVYLQTLPPVAKQNKPHDVGFPFNIRRLLGGWKLLFLNDNWVLKDAATPELERGRYLVEALGHCGECHTPRNLLGGLQMSRWLSGGPNPSGKGKIPNITPGRLDWSEADLMAYFTTGFKPDFDTVGGEMTEVVENLSQMPAEDLNAIIAYLKAVPAVESR